MNFKTVVESRQTEIIEKLQELLRIPSVLDESSIEVGAPFGKPIQKALDYMLDLAKQDGFETLNDEGYAGVIRYGENTSGKTVGILCHLDVVPEGKGWKYPPYEARIVDGKIYARGAGDDKGPTMACYYALKLIQEAQIPLKNQIQLILGTDEETNWRGIAHYLEHYEAPSIGFAPDADFPLIYGEKGRMSFDLTSNFLEDDIVESIHGGERYNVVLDEVQAVLKQDVKEAFYQYLDQYQLKGSVNGNVYTIYGTAAHAMEPFKGVNAGCHMCHFLKDYSKQPMIQFVDTYLFQDPFLQKMQLDYNDDEMGPITVNVGIMHMAKDTTRVTLDLRFPVRYNIENFYAVLYKILENAKISITNQTYKEPHYVSPNDELVTSLYQSYQNHTQDTVNKPFTIGGGTYAGVLKKGVAFGMLFPGEEELAHQKDEYISIESLLKSILIYIDAILSLGEVDA